jgi:hypothetical protein
MPKARPLRTRAVQLRAALTGRTEAAQAPAGATEQAGVPEPTTVAPFRELYVTEEPSAQLTVDIFSGQWSSALPPHLGVSAGEALLFEDPRVQWLLDRFDLTGWQVLELGPLEGGHSHMLQRAGAGSVLAIESNSGAYLRCLVAKELLSLSRCRFLFGDFNRYLEAADRRFDLVLASGVLYHSVDPVGLLERIARVTDRVFIWTHYFDATVIAGHERLSRLFLADPIVRSSPAGPITLHRRDYREALHWQGFCGGPTPYAYWLERDDLMAVLRSVGMDEVEIAFDQPEHVNGPNLLLLAQRSGAS